MSDSDLVFRGETWQVPRRLLMAKCVNFKEDRALLAKPYEVQSNVRRDNFQVFVKAIKGENIAITAGNFLDLDLLCKEFRFLDLSAKVSQWLSGHPSLDLAVLREVNSLYVRIDDLLQKFAEQRKECCEQGSSHEKLICCLEEEIARLKSESVRLQGENGQLRSDIAFLKREAARISQSNANLEDALGQHGKVAREISQLGEKMTEDLAKFREEVREMTEKLKEEVLTLAKGLLIPKTEGAGRSALPSPTKRFAPSGDCDNGIIAHLTEKCGGNVDDRGVVAVTSSKPAGDRFLAKNAADLGNTNSCFLSAGRSYKEDIPHTGNNWICYDFKKRVVVPTDYAICANCLKNWVVETSRDGKTWVEVDRRENVKEMNDVGVTQVFAVSRREECRFIRLVNIGRNWFWTDQLVIFAWEIFGSLVE